MSERENIQLNKFSDYEGDARNIIDLSNQLKARERRVPVKYSDFVLYHLYHSKDVPTTFNEAMASEESVQCQTAMKNEMDSLKKFKVWEFDDSPEDRKVIKCKWVYSVKRNEKGEIVSYEAHLVVKGFTQEFGTDCNETFSVVF